MRVTRFADGQFHNVKGTTEHHARTLSQAKGKRLDPGPHEPFARRLRDEHRTECIRTAGDKERVPQDVTRQTARHFSPAGYAISQTFMTLK